MILPPATLGLLGGGQLGRMFTAAARTMGYEVVVVDPDPLAPAAHFASDHIRAPFDDPAALELLAGCAAVTTEFENAPAESLLALAQRTVISPPGGAVAVAQDRIREKTFFRARGFPVGAFAVIEAASDLDRAATAVRFPALLKTARLGYDGKGQIKLDSATDLSDAWERLGRGACVLEEFLPLEREVSVVLARGRDGATAVFPVAENRHRHGILDTTIVPARVRPSVAAEARELATRLAQALDYVGVLAVEMFVVGASTPLLNEIAPRPHNSGHFTIDACVTSQFEQQVRALCGLPLGAATLDSPVVMVNLLGDLWAAGEPDWGRVFAQPGAKLHLYGKREARPGRKMGHFTVRAPNRDDALAIAESIAQQLKPA